MFPLLDFIKLILTARVKLTINFSCHNSFELFYNLYPCLLQNLKYNSNDILDFLVQTTITTNEVIVMKC